VSCNSQHLAITPKKKQEQAALHQELLKILLAVPL
jgi:hypothetical protein